MKKEGRLKKKALSVMLALVMVFGIMPLNTFAAEPQAKSVPAAKTETQSVKETEAKSGKETEAKSEKETETKSGKETEAKSEKETETKSDKQTETQSGKAGSKSYDSSDLTDLIKAIDALPKVEDAKAMKPASKDYDKAKKDYMAVMDRFEKLTEDLDDDAYSAVEKEIGEKRLNKLAALELQFSKGIQPLSTPENSPELFITLKGVDNSTAFGVENAQGVFEGYRIGAVGKSGSVIVNSDKFRLSWMADIPKLGTSQNGRVIKITVPKGFEIRVWNSTIVNKLVNRAVVTTANPDGSITYTLNIIDGSSVNGQFGQDTEVRQDARAVFNDYYPGKSYDFTIDYYTDEQTDPIKSDKLVFKPTDAEVEYNIQNTLNDMQYAPDFVGDNYKLTEHSIFSFYNSTYVTRNGGALDGSYIPSDYQSAVALGKMYYTSTNNTNPSKSVGSPTSRLFDKNSNGSYGGLNPYPGLLPAVTIDKTEGYLQKDMTVSIPLPAYADGSSSSLRLYDRKDGRSGFDRLGANYLDGTCVYFQPDGTDDLYCLPAMSVSNTNGVYKAEFNAQKELVTIKMAPEQYLNSYYYIDGDTSYMDLLSRPGKIYVNLCMYADASKLLDPQFLGKVSDGTVGDDHQIVAKDKVSISYTDTKNNGAVVNTDSTDKLTLNFHAKSPEITYTSHLGKDKNSIQEQAFNTDSKYVVESVALAPKSTINLLQNWNHVGGKDSGLDLGRGQTNMYFEYSYDQAYSPISFKDLFNGISHAANMGSYSRTNQNSTYTITISNPKTGATRTIVVDGDWKGDDGAFSNEVTTAQLALTDGEYVSGVRVENPIAYICGWSFADNTIEGWGVFTANYRAKDKIYEPGGQEKQLQDGYIATAKVEYGSDQIAKRTLNENVKLLNTYNNFTVGTSVDYGNSKSYGAVPVNDNSSIYTLYGFYVRKYSDTMLYDEDDYPTITVSGQGMELSDTIMTDYSTNTAYDDRYNYYRKAVVPLSYVNQDGETVSLKNIDWDKPEYNLGNDSTFNTFVEKRMSGLNTYARGYVLTDILKANGDDYAKSVTLELRMNHIDANNASELHNINLWLACHKLKPGYLNYDGVIGTSGKSDLGEDWKDTVAKSYTVNISAKSSLPFVNMTKGRAISGLTAGSNHVFDKIYKNTYKIVYGIKNDKTSVTDLDHYLNPIDSRWTGTDVPGAQSGAYTGMLRPGWNVPYSGVGSAAGLLQRNKETALTEVSFDAQYSALKKTLNEIPNADCTATAYQTVANRGPLDYKQISFDFAGSDPDVLALTNGFAINTYGGYQYISGVELSYTTNKNASPQQKKMDGRTSWVQTNIGEHYVYFDLRGLLQEGEYFKSLKLTMPEEWSEFIMYTQYRYGADDLPTTVNTGYRKDQGMPNIRLTRIGTLPKNYPASGGAIGQNDDGFDEYDKLDVKCTMSYSDVFDSKTSVEAEGKSSRIVGQKMTVDNLALYHNSYANKKTSASDPTSSTFQGGVTIWTNQFYFAYSDNGSLDVDRKVKPVLYYKINPDYVPRLDSLKINGKKPDNCGATVSYIPPGIGSSGYSDYGVLVVDCKDTDGMKQLQKNVNSVVCDLDVKADANTGNNVPVPEMWMDIPYDRDTKNNNPDNEQYAYTMEIAPVGKGGVLNSILYGSNYNNGSSSEYPGQLDADGNGAVMLKADMPQLWNIMKYVAAGAQVKAISHYPHKYNQEVYSRDLNKAADNDPSHYIFQSETTLITPMTSSQNWVAYIPVAKKGGDNDFGMKLVDVDVESIKDIGAEGVKIYYTNREDFTENELENTGTDTDYLEWTSGDPEDLKDATCVKVTIDKMLADTRGHIFCSYKLDERKSKVGDQDAKIAVDVAYTNGALRIVPFANGGDTNILIYTLKDMTVQGKLWLENDWNSKMDSGEGTKKDVAFSLLMDGDPVDQGTSVRYKTDAQGKFTLLAPREGEYKAKITVPDGYQLVRKKASTDESISSWFDRTTNITDAFDVEAVRDKYSFETVVAGIAVRPSITLDTDNTFIHVTDKKAGKVTASVENRKAGTTVAFALKNGAPADIATVHDLNDESVDFDGDKAGVTTVTASIEDGYDGVVTKDFAVTVYGNVKYDNNTGSGTVTDSNKYYPSVKDDGADAKTDEVTVKSGDSLSKKGYVFKGWNEKPDGSGTSHAAGSKFQTGPIKGDLTLYAQWKAINYSVKFDKNTKSTNGLPLSGSVTGDMPDQSMTYDQAANLNANSYALDGYDFKGWNSKEDGSGTAYADGESVINITAEQGGTVTIYAQWKAHSYKITFDKNTVDSDGNPLAGTPEGTTPDKAMTYGKEDKLPKNGYSLKGYTFGGWVDDKGNTYTDEAAVKNLTSTDGGELTLKAVWNINEYELKYQYTEDVPKQPDPPVKSKEKYNREITIAESPMLQGYDFSGWTVKTPAGLTVNGGKFNMPASNVVIEGSWIAHKYTVSYDKNSDEATGTTDSSKHVYDKESKLTPNGFERPGYVFAGWSLTPDGDVVAYEDEATVKNLTADKDGNVTLYALWLACTPVTADPPVKKEISGDKDKTAKTFRFKFEAVSNTAGLDPMPMPSAANGRQSMEASIVGAGSHEFGVITFTKPGTYLYRITEIDDGLTGYTYDKASYTVEYLVTQNGKALEVKRTIKKNGNTADNVVFKNHYKAPKLPAGKDGKNGKNGKSSGAKTGDSSKLSLILILLTLSLIGLVVVILVRRRRR